MRIISGICKGLRLNTPPGKSQSIRPTSDRSREALFSILGNKITDARVLDLFAGTGALGLEALSRGARSVVFVDNSSIALKLLKGNIKLFNKCVSAETGLSETKVIKGDLSKGLGSIIKYHDEENLIFDIIFLDPPYEKGLSFQILTHLDSNKFLADNGTIVAEDRSNTNLSVGFQHLVLRDKRKYGDTGFWFYKRI